MPKINILSHLLLSLFVVLLAACDVNRTIVTTAPAATVLTTDVTSAPFVIAAERSYDTGIGVQSFAMGRTADKWLIVGGRINGFHRTGGGARTFPSRYSNDRLYVIEESTGDTASALIPEAYRVGLMSTNMPFTQKDGILYCVGGYGSSCAADLDSCYQTFPYLHLLDVEALVDAIWSGDSNDLGQYIQRITDDRMKVTGGMLHIINDDFYLVFGQDYRGKYADANNGVYTEEVRIFDIDQSGPAPKITNYRTIKDPSGERGTASEFHRRDLNVVPAIRADGELGLDVYGGVFNTYGSAYLNPIIINGNTASVDKNVELTMGLYECGHISMYDPRTSTMYTSMLGGIGTSFYNEEGKLQPGNLPFNKAITHVIHRADGQLIEEVQPANQQLPGFLGANAVFIADSHLQRVAQHGGIIDFSQLPMGQGKILLGRMYGGILTTGSQVSGSGASIANTSVYNIYLVHK